MKKEVKFLLVVLMVFGLFVETSCKFNTTTKTVKSTTTVPTTTTTTTATAAK